MALDEDRRLVSGRDDLRQSVAGSWAMNSGPVHNDGMR
jgi:hypothetical protein